LFGFMGVGAVIGVLELARHKGIGELPGMVLQCMLLMAGALIGLALSPWFGLSLVLMLAVGFSVMRQNAAGNSLLQTTVPDEYRGRLMALYSMAITGLMPIGSLTAGFFAEHFGARAVVFGAAICCLAGGIGYRFAMSSLHLWVKQHEEHVCAV